MPLFEFVWDMQGTARIEADSEKEAEETLNAVRLDCFDAAVGEIEGTYHCELAGEK